MGFRLANVGGRAVLLEGDRYYDVETSTGGAISSCPMLALASAEQLHGIVLSDHEPSGSVADVELGPPVPRPQKIFGVGLNYRAHAEESGMEIPEQPMVFAKYPSCLVGPTAAVVLRSDYCDYEAELVAVIGRAGKDIDEEAAWEYVVGLTCGQDISDRKAQFSSKPPQFTLGKSFDTFGPTGPMVVSLDLIADRDAIPLACWVNGEERQSSNTNDLIFSVPALVAYLSRITRLEPGDLIFTGTPSGVGAATRTYLAEGDVVTTRLDGLGEMRNRCVRG